MTITKSQARTLSDYFAFIDCGYKIDLRIDACNNVTILIRDMNEQWAEELAQGCALTSQQNDKSWK